MVDQLTETRIDGRLVTLHSGLVFGG